MNTYNIQIEDVVDYNIEAENEEEATEYAMSFWAERIPFIKIKQINQ